MSYICSNVCPYEEYCTGNCIKGIKSEPVKVYKLEKFVNLWARNEGIKYIPEAKKNNGIKIAIIGSGPAGISAAVELAKEGFGVTIFEKENNIGGLLTYGIPGFRLPRNATNTLKDVLDSLKITIKTNLKFGEDITIDKLKENGFKSILIAIGAGISSQYRLTNEENSNIYKADHILKEYNAKKTVKNLGDVVVIGGGNVATDSARAAIRMGAKSATILYRRNNEKMPAREIELEEAIKDGVKIIYNTKVKEAIIENKKIKQVKCVKTIENYNGLQEIENSEFYKEANSIIFAIGLKPNKEILQKEGIILENDFIKIDENNKTNLEGVFASGDVMQSKATVCMAILEGKKAAKAIKNYCIN